MSRAKKLLIRKERNEKRAEDSNASLPIFSLQNSNPKKERLDLKINIKEKYYNDKKHDVLKWIDIVAYTSISPSHANEKNQLMAIESWHKHGIEVRSFNTEEEIMLIRKKYPDYVNFYSSYNTTKHIFGKPCILISDMIHHFKNSRSGTIMMLINSDISINASEELLDRIKSMSKLCMPMAHRDDYKNYISQTKKYSFGFDVFFINREYASVFPPSMYSMGQTWWDYWVPYMALKNKIQTILINDSFAFHKEHAIQYQEDDWRRMTEYFKWENNIKGDNHQEINDNTRNQIINNSIPLTLCQRTQSR